MPTRRVWLGGSALWVLHALQTPTQAWAQAPAAAAAATADMRVLIGRATRLSVLSDRVTRCQVQRVLQVLVPRAERQLEDTQREVQDFMSLLQTANLPAGTKDLLRTAVTGYESFLNTSRQLNVSTPNALVPLAEEADAVGDKMDALVGALVAQSGQPMGQVLATVADLQRLTQHTAVHFLMASAGIQAAEQLKAVEQARKEFTDKLKALQASPPKNPAIESQLQLLGPQWLLMANALSHPGRDIKIMENICTTSERMLEVTTSLYRLYDSVLKG